MRFRIASHCAVAASSNRLIITSEDGVRIFEGPAYLPAVNQATQAGVANDTDATAAANEPTQEVAAAIKELIERRVLVPADQPNSRRALYWEDLNCDPGMCQASLNNLLPECADLLERGIKANGIELVSNASFLVVATDDYLRPEVAQLAQRPKPWILTKPIGHTLWLGPLFIPGKTACWSCLESALRGNRWMQAGSGVPQWQEWPPLPSAAALPSTVAIAAGMISTVVAVYLAKGAYPDLEDQILTLDTRTMRFAYNRIRSRADCLRCATRGARAVDNDNLQMLVSPITGIVSGMEVSDRDAAGFFHANAWTVRPKVVSPRTPMRPSSTARANAGETARSGARNITDEPSGLTLPHSVPDSLS